MWVCHHVIQSSSHSLFLLLFPAWRGWNASINLSSPCRQEISTPRSKTARWIKATCYTLTHTRTHTHISRRQNGHRTLHHLKLIDCRGELTAWSIDDAFCLNEIEDSIPGKFCTIGFLISHPTTFVGSSFLFQYIVTPCMTHQNLLKQGRHCNKMNRIQ